MNPQDLQDVKMSFGRCLTSGDLFQEFYDIFLASDPGLAPMFAHTDFERQKGLLRHGLNLALMFAGDNPIGKSGLAKIRKSHSKTELNISPAMYPLWTESFIKAIKKMDPQCDSALENKWRDALNKAVDYIKGGYNE